MVKMYYDNDADLNYIRDKKVAIIGYGSQGHAHALNLKESGIDVRVGLRKESSSWEKAEKAGLRVTTPDKATAESDIVMILVPDETQGDIFKAEIASNLKKGDSLAFAHGFNIHYSQIVPPKDINVFMVAPKGPGHLVRRVYQEGKGVPCLLAIHQDSTGNSKELALAYARAIGGTRAGVLETSFKDETETDLFGEQAVLCGGASELIRAGFDTLVNAGYKPELAYFECLHELKLIVDLIYEGGISKMRYSISDTAQYGDITRGKRVITEKTREDMKKILGEIQSGEFAKEWILENKANRPVFNSITKKDSDHEIEQVGTKLRKMMSWIK